MIIISRSRSISETVWCMFYFFTFVLLYWSSYYLLTLYQYGDQKHYTDFYYAVRGASLSDVPILQLTNTGSAEPFYGYMVWLASNAGLEKVPLMAAFNGAFGVLIAATIRKLNGNIALILIMFTNYYFVVLITAAERLKFSYMAFCLAILVGGRIGTALLLSSPLVHLQSVITIASIASARLLRDFLHPSNTLWIRIKLTLVASLGFLFLLLAFLKFQESVLAKFASSSSLDQDLFGFLQIIVLTGVALIIARRKWETLFYFAPIVMSAAILGGSRVNMIGVVILFFLALKAQRSYHPLLVALYIYFAYKSVGFINNILEYGVGFL